MKNGLLAVAALAEALTGLVLLIYPPIVIKLLFGTDIADVGLVISCFAGIALLGLGISCWPSWTALYGMLTYSALATLYLAYLGIRGDWVGPLLWPAVVLHAVLTLLLARVWFKPQKGGSASPEDDGG
jgi:hypothetical protein